MSLEKEAKEFQSAKKTSELRASQAEKTALRFYMGQAMSGILIANPALIRDHEEFLRQALEVARSALKKEEDF